MIRREIHWKMKAALIGLLIALALVGYLRAAEVHQISDAQRLQVSQLEAELWRRRYAVEKQEDALSELIASIRSRCEQSGGVFSMPHSVDLASSIDCAKQDASDR